MADRFSRLERIIGKQGAALLASSTVAVFGLGGVGGMAAEALARSGVGRLVLVDHDQVDETNINRQVVALESTIGEMKVSVMASRLKDINPVCEVVRCPVFYDETTAAQLLQTDYSYVVDAIDTVSAKVDLLRRCVEQSIPVISSMGAGNKLDPTQLQVADISATHTCPLARVIRQALRRVGIRTGLDVVFSTEPPQGVHQDRTPGSSAFVPPAAGLVMASVVVKNILHSRE